MAFDPSRLSVAELKQRFGEGGAAPSPALLGKLRADPRQGVQALAGALSRRLRAGRDRQRRLASLLAYERQLRGSGFRSIAGVDEAGIGPLAGPVVAAAVIFPPEVAIPGVDDSKRLAAGEREELAGEIRRLARAFAIGVAEVAEIDRLNIYHAGLLAMRRAVAALSPAPDHLLIDARRLPELAIPQSPVIGGDRRHFSIAAASILAKVHRDRLMVELEDLHPGYGFARHKGYPTADHQEALRRRGACAIHRRSFPAVRQLCGDDLPLLRGL